MKFPWGDGEKRKQELNEEIAAHLQMAARDRAARDESSERPLDELSDPRYEKTDTYNY